MHYSPLAAVARAAGIAGHEDSFERFKGSVSLELVLATAEEVLNASVPASLRDETLARLARSQLSESRQQLIFNYKLAFEHQDVTQRWNRNERHRAFVRLRLPDTPSWLPAGFRDTERMGPVLGGPDMRIPVRGSLPVAGHGDLGVVGLTLIEFLRRRGSVASARRTGALVACSFGPSASHFATQRRAWETPHLQVAHSRGQE